MLQGGTNFPSCSKRPAPVCSRPIADIRKIHRFPIEAGLNRMAPKVGGRVSRSFVKAIAVGVAVSGCSLATYDLKEMGYTQGQVAPIPSDAVKIRFLGSVYRRLSGPKLRGAVAGRSMFYDPVGPGLVMTSGVGVQHFNSDGCGYAKERHRAGPTFGIYWVEDDRVCTKIKDAAVASCFALFESGEGRWLRHDLSMHKAATNAITLLPHPRFLSFDTCLVVERN